MGLEFGGVVVTGGEDGDVDKEEDFTSWVMGEYVNGIGVEFVVRICCCVPLLESNIVIRDGGWESILFSTTSKGV